MKSNFIGRQNTVGSGLADKIHMVVGKVPVTKVTSVFKAEVTNYQQDGVQFVQDEGTIHRNGSPKLERFQECEKSISAEPETWKDDKTESEKPLLSSVQCNQNHVSLKEKNGDWFQSYSRDVADSEKGFSSSSNVLGPNRSTERQSDTDNLPSTSSSKSANHDNHRCNDDLPGVLKMIFS